MSYTVLSLVGAAWLASYAISIVRVLVDLARPGLPLSNFGAKQGTWALVTGATSGIGRDFALQLAEAGFNVFLASRSASKLDEISSEITAKYPNVKTQVYVIDFASAGQGDYDILAAFLKSFEIGVLINNVGQSYDIPTFFQDVPDTVLSNIIQININATLRVTKLVIPGMVSRKKGLILTVGSMAGHLPSPLLAVYSGSKAFLAAWSQALGSELEGTGVVVELLNTYFVVSNISKIRKPSWMIPTPAVYVRSVLCKIGVNGGAVGHPYMSNPYHGHAPVQWVVDHLLTNAWWLKYNRKLHVDIRNRALRKKDRDNGKAVKAA